MDRHTRYHLCGSRENRETLRAAGILLRMGLMESGLDHLTALEVSDRDLLRATLAHESAEVVDVAAAICRMVGVRIVEEVVNG